jgi:hypothetical protein
VLNDGIAVHEDVAMTDDLLEARLSTDPATISGGTEYFERFDVETAAELVEGGPVVFDEVDHDRPLHSSHDQDSCLSRPGVVIISSWRQVCPWDSTVSVHILQHTERIRLTAGQPFE